MDWLQSKQLSHLNITNEIPMQIEMNLKWS